MIFQNEIKDLDLQLAEPLKNFIPQEVFDIHAHPYSSAHFPENEWSFLRDVSTLGCDEHCSYLKRYMPADNIHGLYFGMPRLTAHRDEMNDWVREEVFQNGSPLSRHLIVVSPTDDQKIVRNMLNNPFCCGMKVYHCYADRKDTMNANISEYAPEWMWELLNDIHGVLMLHIVKNRGIGDEDNQNELRYFCTTYPNVRVVLAHVARSFNYRNARRGMESIADLSNVVVDTSAICESEAYKEALRVLGPQRILWGSDFAVSEMRGRCVTTGDRFFWLHPEIIDQRYQAPSETHMTLIGIESLLALKESCEDMGLDESDVQDIFLNNALRMLKPHLQDHKEIKEPDNQDLWKAAKNRISGGTGLLSKRAEQFNTEWPSFFSRSRGGEVWDLNGKKYMDCAGGIGAVLIGYADEEINAAIKRRLLLGSYSSLVNPQEMELAEKLLSLHPWAGKVRYARTGGEAMAVSVRIARAASGKSGVAFCGYHGWHDWYLAANIGATDALDGHLLPGLQPKGVPRELRGTAVPFQYNDWESFLNAATKLENNFGVVVMEPMRSQFPKDDFLNKIRAYCSDNNIVMVVDEITSGLRYGYPGALSRLGVVPDIVVYAKAMGNGFPFATIIGKDEVMDEANESFISSSYWTDGIGTAAALAVLGKMERENIHQSVWDKGEVFQKKLVEVAKEFPSVGMTIGGMPASPTFTFSSAFAQEAKKSFNKKMQDKEILVSGIFYLMHAHRENQLRFFVDNFEKSLHEIEQEIETGVLKPDVGRGFQHGFTRLT